MLIDIHHHLIYGVDDGAQTQEMMYGMLRKASENNIRHVVATSHITPGLRRFPAETYLAHLAEANDYCAAQGLNLSVHPGAEILWTEETPRMLREGYVPTLDQTWNVLVEFNTDVKAERLYDCARLLGNEGLQVVFAHIERYRVLRDIKKIQTLKDEYGVMMQMNCGTVLHKLGFFEERWKEKVLSGGYIDMVATDAHSLEHRSCNLLACYQALGQRYGQEYADDLCFGCQAELLGLDPDEPFTAVRPETA